MENKRLLWVDSLKGWLITLVVLGHSIQNTLGVTCDNNHLWNLIYSFHMPAFMAISGFLTYRSHAQWGRRLFITQSNRRFRQLIVPFIIWTFLFLLIGSRFSLDNIVICFLYPDRGLWFLWALFFISVFFNFGNWLSERINIKQEIVILSLCILFAGSMVLFEFRLFGFQFIAYYFLFFSLGYFLNKYYERVVTKNTLVIVLSVTCWGILAWFWKMHELPSCLKTLSLPNSLVQYAYRFITAALAIYVLFAISPRLLNSDSKWNIPFVDLGCVSLGIYTAHFIIIGRLVSWFRNWVCDETMIIILSFITALLISWLVVSLLSRWKITAKVFLGKI